MKIGIFDSGFGGLTIFKSIRASLPQYDYVYLGDNARTPYGNRSFDAIFQFSKQCLEILFAKDCHLVIIACNTASAKALRTIQQKVLPLEHPDRKVLGIIRPSAEALANLSSGLGLLSAAYPDSVGIQRHVALWATEGTVKSLSFPLEMEKLAPGLGVIQQACPMLVPLVEAGELEGAGIDYFISKYWQETLAQSTSRNIEALLLACTHYPLLYPKIRALLPPEVTILVQGDIVAPSLVNYFQRHPELEATLSKGGSQHFLTTDQTEGFDRLAKVFLGHTVISEKVEI
jgi:glutamate racemase